jgi:hypothetical protein
MQFWAKMIVNLFKFEISRSRLSSGYNDLKGILIKAARHFESETIVNLLHFECEDGVSVKDFLSRLRWTKNHVHRSDPGDRLSPNPGSRVVNMPQTKKPSNDQHFIPTFNYCEGDRLFRFAAS